MDRVQFNERFAQLLPAAPGVYKYYDRSRKLLYVGKAKNLRKRVGSYFVKTHDNRKTQRLVALIDQMEWIITDDEHDAFLMENSLIKHFQPPFNVNLKDDKTYPYVVIKNEPFPRVFLTRRKIKDGSEYIGPFTDVGSVRSLLTLIRQYIPLRTCGLNLSHGNIAKGKFKVCLEYHLGNCKGPCEGLQSATDYTQSIATIRQLLKGNLHPLVSRLKEEMNHYADTLQYERAQQVKARLDSLQNYQSKSTVVSAHLHNIDVATICSDDDQAFVNYMMVAGGRVIHSKSIRLEKKLNETEPELLAFALSHFRSRFQSEAHEVVLPFPVETTEADLKITVPRSGDKKKLQKLSFKNATYFKEEFIRRARLLLKDSIAADRLETLEQLQEDLMLPELPEHIECFDNSNFQGSFPVAAMVCFKGGLPSKSDYRHFHIKTVKGINDFASMTEIVHRRYARLLKEDKPLPQLVIIDGGKGQLGAAMKSIEALGLIGRMTVVGLAKREESLFFPGDKDPIQLPYNGQSLLFIRKIRDEVHRFGITFHRKARSRGTIKNELETIPGIGQKTAQALLQTYRSVARVKQLTQRELTLSLGASKARLVYQYFHPEG